MDQERKHVVNLDMGVRSDLPDIFTHNTSATDIENVPITHFDTPAGIIWPTTDSPSTAYYFSRERETFARHLVDQLRHLIEILLNILKPLISRLVSAVATVLNSIATFVESFSTIFSRSRLLQTLERGMRLMLEGLKVIVEAFTATQTSSLDLLRFALMKLFRLLEILIYLVSVFLAVALGLIVVAWFTGGDDIIKSLILEAKTK